MGIDGRESPLDTTHSFAQPSNVPHRARVHLRLQGGQLGPLIQSLSHCTAQAIACELKPRGPLRKNGIRPDPCQPCDHPLHSHMLLRDECCDAPPQLGGLPCRRLAAALNTSRQQRMNAMVEMLQLLREFTR